jgi:hypothetical protein
MSNTRALSKWQREYFSPGYKLAFLNAMDLRLQGGESMGRALQSIIEAEPNPAKRRDMAPALDALEQGEPVSESLRSLGFFDNTVLAILHAGERSGMVGAIRSASEHLALRQAWFREHAVVLFLLTNELLSAAFAPVLLQTEILPWIRNSIAKPTDPIALLAYERDMAIAQGLTTGLVVLTVVLILLAVFSIHRLRHSTEPSRTLMFFSDSAMSVGFKLAAAMVRSGVTIEAAARELAVHAPGWAKNYWTAASQQLERAEEPAAALVQPGLYQEERALLANHANARQLTDILGVLALGRQHRAKRARDLLVLGATVFTVSYILMTMAVAGWIYLTYDATLAAGLDALGSGF